MINQRSWPEPVEGDLVIEFWELQSQGHAPFHTYICILNNFMTTKFKYQWGFPELGITSTCLCCLCLSAIILWIYIVKNMFSATKSAFLRMSLLVILLKSQSWVKLLDTLKNWWGLMVCIQESPCSSFCKDPQAAHYCIYTVFTQHLLYPQCNYKRVHLFWQYFIVRQLICSFSLCFPLRCSNFCLVTPFPRLPLVGARVSQSQIGEGQRFCA